MEVTKQKMRCAAAEDPSYPCKHHREGQVSQLPGEEVIVACWGPSPRHCQQGRPRVEPDAGVPQGRWKEGTVGSPGQWLTRVHQGLASEPGSACGRASAGNYHVTTA